MSQASRSHALRFVRWREQAARAVARELPTYLASEHFCQSLGFGWGYVHDRLLRPKAYGENAVTFNVHAAREWAEAELRACDEADAHRVVLEDWTRGKGLGPENREPGAFCDCGGEHGDWIAPPGERWFIGQTVHPRPWRDKRNAGRFLGTRGFGLPGLSWYRYECERCHGKPGGWPGRLMRDPACPVPSWTPNAASRRRVAQRLLDTLNGCGPALPGCPWAPSAPAQSSECQLCEGTGVRKVRNRWRKRLPDQECPDCNGTGHNLRGHLPAVEWPAVVRRRCLEHESFDLHTPTERQREGHQSWVRELGDSARMPHGPRAGITIGSVFLTKVDPETRAVLHTPETRVCERGEHRSAEDEERYLVASTIDPSNPMRSADLMPRWLLGEIRNEERRWKSQAGMLGLPTPIIWGEAPGGL